MKDDSMKHEVPIVIEHNDDFMDEMVSNDDNENKLNSMKASYQQVMLQIKRHNTYRINTNINCSIGDFFEIDEQQLSTIRNTNFSNVRDQICKQGRIYNELISPFGRALLKDSDEFFKSNVVNEYSGDFEAMKK